MRRILKLHGHAVGVLRHLHDGYLGAVLSRKRHDQGCQATIRKYKTVFVELQPPDVRDGVSVNKAEDQRGVGVGF